MRAWVARRRLAGAMLPEPSPIGETPAPFELVVMEVTDQGQRRPAKIARLVPPGTRRTVAELVAPKLVWLRGYTFILAGLEELKDPSGAKEVGAGLDV